MRRLQVYAGPSVFGPWTIVASHLGSVAYDITVTPIGSTVIVSEVRYFAEGDQSPRVKTFFDNISIRTANSVANVEVRVKGIPTGSACWVDINP